MRKETKEPLTKEKCQKDLKALARANCRSHLIFLIAFSIFFGPLAFLSIYFLIDVVPVLSIISFAVFATPIVIFIYNTGKSLIELRMAVRGKFSVIEDDVSQMEEEIKIIHLA